MATAFQSLLKAFRVKINIFPFNYPNNTNADASVDGQGNLWVREGVISPSAGGFVYEAVPGLDTAIILGFPMVLTQTGGFNDSAGSIYVQLFNQDAALVGGEEPVMTFLVPAGSSFSWNPSNGGRIFDIGIVFGVSSTRDTYTAMATNIFIFAEGIIL